MPVAPVFAVAVPAPHTAAFTAGEQALAVADPITAAAGRTLFRLARWFDFEGGTYTFRTVADDSAAWFASVALNNGRSLFRNLFTEGVVERTVYIPRGRMRLDILLSNMSTAASSCYVAFSIRYGGRVVYASSAAGWVFDTAAIPDASVPAPGDRRLSYSLFPFTPNWSGGVTERIEYMTEVMPSETDVEQRRSPRRFARRTFEASFMRHGANRARLDNFFLGLGKSEVLLPLWHEQYKLTATLGSNLTFPQGSLVMREFRAGDLAVLIRNPSDYELLTIASHNLSTDTITFTAPPATTWGAGSRIMPVRVARVMEAVRFENQTDSVATSQARFELSEPLTWPDPSWGYCSPLFRFKPNRTTALSLDFDRRTFTQDTETGPVDVTDPGQRVRVGTRLSLALRGRENVYRFRQFIGNARGRAVRFWMPDWMQDIVPATDIPGSHIDAVPAGFAEYIKVQQDARLMIGVEFKDGRPALYREITAVEEVGSVERFFVDPALPPVLQSEVARIMFVLPSRFDQDSFELQHVVDDSAVVQTTLVVRSAERDGLPDIECFTTSKPYPLNQTDGVDVGMSLVSLSLIQFGVPPGEVNVAMTFVEGELRQTLKNYTPPPEDATDVAMTFVEGELRQALLSYTIQAEAMTISAVLVTGTLQEQVVTYSNYQPEAMTISAEIVGGTLA